MNNKLTTKQWIAVIVSLLTVVIILFSSLGLSSSSQVGNFLKDSPEESTGGVTEEEMTDTNNNWPAGFEFSQDIDGVFKIEDLTIGTGKEALQNSGVVVNYEGFLTDGTKFDSSRDRGLPFEFVLGAGLVIEGWEKGLVGMKEGGIRTIVIPAEMAYGNQQIGTIPANSTLLFIVELVEVK